MPYKILFQFYPENCDKHYKQNDSIPDGIIFNNMIPCHDIEVENDMPRSLGTILEKQISQSILTLGPLIR